MRRSLSSSLLALSALLSLYIIWRNSSFTIEILKSEVLHKENKSEVQDKNIAIEKRFKERLNVLHNVCKEYPKYPGGEITLDIEHKRFLYAKGILACSNAKVGSQTMRIIFYSIVGIHPARIYAPEGNVITASNALGTDLLDEYMSKDEVARSAGISRVMLVRNPLDRLVSVYREKYNGGLPFTCCYRIYKISAMFASNQLKAHDGKKMSLTFEQFIKGTFDLKDHHWIPMHKKCSPCYHNYDYILKLETFKDDLKYIFEASGIEEQNDESSTERNNSTNKAGEKKSMESYYQDLPKELLRKIFKRYKMDLLLFGYEIPDFLKEFNDENTNENK